MNTLKEFANAQLPPAQKIVCEGKELTPMLIIETAASEIVIVVVNEYGDPQVKGPAREMMKLMLEEHGATRYAFVMEAWLGSPPKFPAPNYLPSKDPERLEAIVVTAAASDGQKVMVVSQIKRSGKEIVFETMGFDRMPMGPLADLFGTDTRQ